ncbi:DUF2062 domain-containing protein [Aestuariispira ectoiniformans]|uniref:DUF2062 domain-containing protein n=1 Tax=Aestuariispira ectoiniformans TaxID=2775080 RepID=UPI00223A9146|nr:DUF2062 domain-containing protein [Aestuariispira ectoiniformans]
MTAQDQKQNATLAQEDDNKAGERGWFGRLRHRSNRHRFDSKMARLVYYRLFVPMRRERRSPKVIAWGVAIGLFIGMTPTVGIQMPLVAILWWLARQFQWNFSLILAIAWSWLSNAATMIPLYYLFYVTGLFILPGDGQRFSFEAFSKHIESNMAATETLEGSFKFIWDLIENIGLSIIVGCLPYAIILSVLGYWFSLQAAKSYSRMKAAREDNS